MKVSIEQLKTNIAEARTRHTEASKDIKRIEKDMKDFDSNKDSKLAELQASVDALRKAHNTASTAARTLQKELQTARLDVEQTGADQAAAQEQLDEVIATEQAQQDEIRSLQEEQARVKVMITRVSACFVADNSIEYRMNRRWLKLSSMMNVQN